MKKRIVALVCALAMVLTSQSFVNVLDVQAASEQTSVGTTYYFSNNGDNSNSGTAENQAWQTLNKLENVTLQPGDQVLLEKGSIFHGYIHLIDVHGTEEAPIKIGSYGTGNKPVINTNGEGIWYQDYVGAMDNSGHKSKGYISSSILLYDVDYVEIDGLELTNQSDDLEYIQNGINNLNARMDRTGVAGIAKERGTMRHVYLNDLYIHDIDGNVHDKHINNGGIQMNVSKPANEEETGIARYDDIRITNCHIKNVRRGGLFLGYTYQHARFNGAAISDSVIQKYGHTNIYVANNYLQNIGNDAMNILYAYRPVVERNISDTAGMDLDDGYSGYWQSFCAAIWPWKTKDAIFQYNEAFDTVGPGNGDGQAWDIDYSDGTIYQYNYSHNNGGGSMLICLGEAYQGTFRYNLSYNDLKCLITFQGNPLAKIYNNVFYIDGDLSTRIHHPDSGKRSGTGQLYNNIFYNASTANPNDDWQPSNNKTYSNNIYYGYSSTPSTDENAIVVTDGSSIFKGPLTAPTSTNGKVHDLSEFEGFKLAENSPAINAGIYVGAEKDFFGNPVDLTPDIGIHETTVAATDVSVIVYSNEYNVTEAAISGVETGTKVSDLKAGLIYDSRVTLEVLNGAAAAADTAFVKDGMTVKVSYEGMEKTYTVSTVMTVESLVYTVGNTDIRDIVEGTTAAQFKANMLHHANVTAAVYNGEAVVAEDAEIADGMVLRLECDGVAKEYALYTVKSYSEYSVAGMTATAGSEQPNNATEGDPNYVLDDNTGTMWHTNWNGCTRDQVWIMIDMGAEQDVAMLKYVPRQSGGNNGKITKYEVWAGTTADNLEKVAEGNWEDSVDTKYAYFEQINARYVKLVGVETTTTTSLIFGSAAEIRLGYEN